METETAVVVTKTRRTRNAPKCDVASKKIKLSKMDPVSDPKFSSRYLMLVHNMHGTPFPKEGNPQQTPEVKIVNQLNGLETIVLITLMTPTMLE